LHRKLIESAAASLTSAVSGADVSTLEVAIAHACAFSLPPADIERARERLSELNGEVERQAQRESYGLGTLPLPDEFLCPITFDKLRDPVVASDGNTYERHAIQAVLQSPNPRSPLTREPLESIVFPNRALKKRIEEHEEEVLRIAATVAANSIVQAAGHGPSSGATSSDALQRPTHRAPKRRAMQPSGVAAEAEGSKRRRARDGD